MRSQKWTKACDKRLARLISYIHHTCEFRQFSYVVNTAQRCRSGLSQDSDFAGDFEDSKSTSGGCARYRHQSHTVQRKLKLFILMQVLRLDAIAALDLWD